jgi:aldehyde:ferredoxin oxidoreductase
VDLTDRKVEIESPDEKIYRKYLGGACLGAYYVMRETKKGIDPLSPDNILAFTISPLTGAALSGASRHCITTKSPLTGTIASSEAGGFWGPELKFAGFDGIIIKGKADKPVYLWIKDGTCEIRDAGALWGKITGEAQDAIRKELRDDKVRAALIGPGGEKGIFFACIANELKHFNGRNGMGAVMGSKNLKAVAVRGAGKPEFADPDYIAELAKQAVETVKSDDFYALFKQQGTTLNVEWNTAAGGLPTRNWTMGSFPGQDKLTAAKYAEEMMDSPGTCWACAQACKRDIKKGITDPEQIETRYGGPEYETIGMCGSNLLIDDFAVIAAINQIASKYAVDTISLGGVIGFAMECYETGIISSEQLDGLDLRFGNGKAAIALAEKIASREGVGDLLAQGTKSAAEKWGPRAERIAVHVKGKEFPAHMPHTKPSLGLAYACNAFGPDHVSSEHDGAIAADPMGQRHQGLGFYDFQEPGELNFEKGKLLAYSQRWVSGIDSASVCQFLFNTWSIFGFRELVHAISAATGWEYTTFEFMLLGERRVNMMRAFNIREGFGIEDDDLPERLFADPLQDDGPAGGTKIDREKFLAAREAYYGVNGWDPETGIPSEYKMRELGLEWALPFIN